MYYTADRHALHLSLLTMMKQTITVMQMGRTTRRGILASKFIQDYEYDVLVEMSPEYHNVVNKVRKIVKLFKCSPTKNDDILQPYVKRELGREVSLTLDCRTRWDSMVDMLSRFLQL